MSQIIEKPVINSNVTKPSQEKLDELNQQLADATPQEIIKWSIDQYGSGLILACSFGGISGMALLDMTMQLDRSVPVFYLDTEFLFPETYALRDEVAKRYGITPLAFRSRLSPEEQAAQYGEALWERDPDKCCAIRKVEPNYRALDGRLAWITGLRRDQSSTRKQVDPVGWDNKFNLYKISPLWAWGEEEVWGYIHGNDVPFNALHAKGYPSIGCTNCTRPVAEGEDARSGRWANFTKTECGLHR
jgi:phosphoadenosine phosphosulfate reductase